MHIPVSGTFVEYYYLKSRKCPTELRRFQEEHHSRQVCDQNFRDQAIDKLLRLMMATAGPGNLQRG